jgi:enamine deaminase RidA (YjgF/YER057c/UK114 family)
MSRGGPDGLVAITDPSSACCDGTSTSYAEAQTRQVFANLDRALAAAGASFTDVIKLNYYVTDIAMLPVVRAIRDEYVDTARPPASTAVQVSALAMPDLMIEIEAWAVCAD